MRIRPQALIPFVIVALLGLGAALVQQALDRRFAQARTAEAVVYLLDGRLLRRTALGFQEALADVYWLRALQYFGGTHHLLHEQAEAVLTGPEAADPRDTLFRVLNIITDLDPRFGQAYTYGAHFLAHDGDPRGIAWAIRLLDKGTRQNPRDWRYFFDKGFVHYFYAKDYPAAARAFEAGAARPDAPAWLQAIAARSQALGGDRQTARALATYLRDTATEPSTRQSAALLVQQLDALDRRDELEGIVARYRAATGRFPATWGEVVAAGALREVPRDPAGVPFSLDPAAGRVRIARQSPLSAAPGN